MGDQKQIPVYQSAAEISAVQIAKVEKNPQNGGALISFANEDFAPVRVNNNFMNRYNPVRGGFVTFVNGEKAYLSQDAFTTAFEVSEDETLLSPDDKVEEVEEKPKEEVGVNINAVSTDLSAKDAIEAIGGIEDLEKLEAFVVGEERATVIKAFDSKKESLIAE